MRPLRIGWFSELNTSDTLTSSLSAYVSDELLPILRSKVELQLFHAGSGSYRDYPTSHYLCAVEMHRKNPFDLCFYQVEDGPGSHFTRFHLGLIPGVVLFHDFNFVDSGPVPLYVSPWESTVNKFYNSEVPWPPRSFKSVHRGPLGYREGALAAVPVFSSERALDEFRRNIPQSLGTKEHSYFLPFPVDPALATKNSGKTKEFTVAFAGSPRIEHRAHKLLAALKEIGSPCKLRWLISEDENGAVAALLKEFQIDNVEIVTGRSPEAWKNVATGASVAIHTLFSAYGQPGPYLAISLMMNIPSVVSNYGASEYLPESVVFMTQAGDTEAIEIAGVLRSIRNGDGRTQNSREFAVEQFDRNKVAEELLLIFNRSRGHLANVSKRWSTIQGEARSALLEEAHGLFGAMPRGVGVDSWGKIVEPFLKEFGWARGADSCRSK